MMHKSLMIAGALLLSACQAEATNNAPLAADTAPADTAPTANMVSAPKPPAPPATTPSAPAVPQNDTATDVRAAIAKGYADYRLHNMPDTPGFVLTPELDALMDRAQAVDESFPGYDHFCQCQDYDEAHFAYDILSLKVDGDNATATIKVKAVQGDTGDDMGPVVMVLKRNGQGMWQVDDVDGMRQQALDTIADGA